MMNNRSIRPVLGFLFSAGIVLSSCTPEDEEESLTIAVAGNFSTTMDAILTEYRKSTTAPVRSAAASTGKLYAQIISGAPYDIFFSADTEHVQLLLEREIGLRDSVFIYGVGKLVLWYGARGIGERIGESAEGGAGNLHTRSPPPPSPKGPGSGDSPPGALSALQSGYFNYLAVPNPRLAPYGRAAEETLRGLGYWDALGDKLVFGESVDQAFQFVQSGGARLGFAAMSQLIHRGGPASRHWIVPQELYSPIRQAAIILKEGDAARNFMDFVRSEPVRRLIAENGY